MSCYNEYLHHDFKKLGFPEYIKMLDSEITLINFSHLSTMEKLTMPPFFGNYSVKTCFAIIHPSESTGKRPYIGLMTASILDEGINGQIPGVVLANVFYDSFPNRQSLKQILTGQFLDYQRHGLAASFLAERADHTAETQKLTTYPNKRR